MQQPKDIHTGQWEFINCEARPVNPWDFNKNRQEFDIFDDLISENLYPAPGIADGIRDAEQLEFYHEGLYGTIWTKIDSATYLRFKTNPVGYIMTDVRLAITLSTTMQKEKESEAKEVEEKPNYSRFTLHGGVHLYDNGLDIATFCNPDKAIEIINILNTSK